MELDWGTEDSEYLQKVELHSEGALNEVRPDIIIYNAGTDILDGDPLGGLSISPQVLFCRTLDGGRNFGEYCTKMLVLPLNHYTYIMICYVSGFYETVMLIQLRFTIVPMVSSGLYCHIF